MSETFKTLIKEICEENDISVETLSFGYLLRLTKDGQTRHIIGNHIDANAAAADRIASDKCACSLLLNRQGINAIPHELVFNPVRRGNWISGGGTWLQALEYLNKHRRVVVKPNNGWQGHDVYLCETPAELELALHLIFQKEPDACLSPFYEFDHEYRVFCVYNEALYAYGKKRASGDWKHNLSGGASAFEIKNDELLNKLFDTALNAARCININFATVDIAQLKDGSLIVVEINSGVVAQKLLEQMPEMRSVVKGIYYKAVAGMGLLH
jgi:glutathione synthase/RimK-type ligase-like ATP-grasp enzyme